MLLVGGRVHGHTLVQAGEAVVHGSSGRFRAGEAVSPVVRGCQVGRSIPKERRRKSSWCSSRFSATSSCGVMWRDADEREHLVRAPGGEQRGRQLQGVRGDDVVVGEAVDEQQRPCQVGARAAGATRVVAVGVVVGMPEVALGVVGVVEPPFGHRRAGDGGVEHVRSAQHGQRGQEATEAPAANGDAIEIEHPVVSLGGGVRARRPGRRAAPWRGRGGRRAPTPARVPACRGRRRRPPRSPGRRTTARTRRRSTTAATRSACGPP